MNCVFAVERGVRKGRSLVVMIFHHQECCVLYRA